MKGTFGREAAKWTLAAVSTAEKNVWGVNSLLYAMERAAMRRHSVKPPLQPKLAWTTSRAFLSKSSLYRESPCSDSHPATLVRFRPAAILA